MSLLLKQIAYDSGVIDESIVEDTLNDNSNAIAIYQQENPLKSFTGEGYGMKFRANDQEYTDEVFIANSRKELQGVAMHIHETVRNRANDSFDVPSSGVLPWMTSVYTNKFIEQIFQTTPIWKIATDFQQGTWDTTQIYVPVITFSGDKQIYTDLGVGGQNGVNINWLNRDTLRLQRMLPYGDLANAQMSAAKIDYVARLREGMAKQINLDINNIAFYGYAGKGINGVLNDPSLKPVIPFPATSANPGSSNWAYANYAEISANIRSLYAQVLGGAGGNVEFEDPASLTVDPGVYAYLTDQNPLGTQSVMQYLKGTFPNLEIVQSANNAGVSVSTVQLILKQVAGQDVLLNTFSSLYNSHGAVRKESAYVEKISYTVSGSIVAVAMGVATGTMNNA